MKTGFLLAILTAALLLAACATRQPLTAAPPPAPSRQPPKTTAELRPTARQQVAAQLQAGRFAAALAIIGEAREKNGALLEKEYLQALQALAAAGEKNFQRGDYRESGSAARTLLDHFPKTPALAARLPVDREAVGRRLRECAERLMDGGLAEYRAGNLQGAIVAWKEILVFDATHEGAKKAIHTADTQLKNLRSLP
ncbi:MAG: hypothetical protein WDA20_05570 [Desulfuromonadales bacterium]|jgi:tetratricopeptide (TPR) repeat protein